MLPSTQGDFQELYAAVQQDELLESASAGARFTSSSHDMNDSLNTENQCSEQKINEILVDFTAVVDSAESINYEPVRYCPASFKATPPKRFYRSFRRSLARGIIQNDRMDLSP
jgi:hypothetical protein